MGLGPSASERKKIWRLKNYISIADWLYKNYHAHIIVLGNKQEENIGKEMKERSKASIINIVGKTTLRQASAILNRCSLFIGNDSGLMHIASASGIPVIEISCHPISGAPDHPYSPRRFGPWGVAHRILQPETATYPCSDNCISNEPHCILNVDVEKVKKAVSELLIITLR